MAHAPSSPAAIDWLPAPVVVRGPVQKGFGRGSRDLGTPTANLPGHLLRAEPAAHRDGVYLGFAAVPALRPRRPVKMVANLGRNITYDDVPERVLEAYLMADFAADFYGEEMRLVILGFMRPEYKFASVDELVHHIRNDVAVADAALDLPIAKKFSTHESLMA